MASPAMQPLLSKIIRRVVQNPGDRKRRRLKLTKLQGKLSGASLLALRNHGWVESEPGILSLPVGKEGDQHAECLLKKLNIAQAKVTARPANAAYTLQQVIVQVAESERLLGLMQCVDPRGPSPDMFEQHPAQLRETAKILRQVLERALKASPNRFIIPTSGVDGIQSVLARVNMCKGAVEFLYQCGFKSSRESLILPKNAHTQPLRSGLQKLAGFISRDTTANARARASAVDRLASSARKKKTKKSGASPNTTREITESRDSKEETDSVKLASCLSRLDLLQNTLRSIKGRLGVREGYHLEWTVGNWRLKEVSDAPKNDLYCPTSILDSWGRRWKSYLRKGNRDPKAPESTLAGRYDYSVGVFLECASKRKLPAKVYLRATLVHPWSKTSIEVPGVAQVASGTFTKEVYAMGVPYLIEGGGGGRLAGIGAWDPNEDSVTVRIEFALGYAEKSDVDERRREIPDYENEKVEQKQIPKDENEKVEQKEIPQLREGREVGGQVTLSDLEGLEKGNRASGT
ncbi:hypothetical protein AAMO2058_001049400 [Amorphochlora amoebiformis]